MFRVLFATAACAVALGGAVSASAQSSSSSTTRSTTTTTVDGNTTTTTTRSTTTSGSIDVDADQLVDSLIGMFGGEANPEAEALRRRAEPARAEDVFGEWSADDGGRDASGCRYSFGERAFLGARSVSAQGCPSRLARVSNYRVQQGELLIYQGAGDQDPLTLLFVDGRFVGDGLTLRRDGDDGAGPTAAEAVVSSTPGRLSRESAAGEWKTMEMSSMGNRRECTVRLTTNESFGRLGASTSGCFEDLMFVSGWRLEDGKVVLYKAGGDMVAELRGNSQRISGRTADGADVVLYR